MTSKSCTPSPRTWTRKSISGVLFLVAPSLVRVRPESKRFFRWPSFAAVARPFSQSGQNCLDQLFATRGPHDTGAFWTALNISFAKPSSSAVGAMLLAMMHLNVCGF